MASVTWPILIASLLLLHYPGPAFGFGWWFLWPTTTEQTTSGNSVTTSATETNSSTGNQSSNGLQIALGNRENSDTIGTDGGTNISNVEVNYARNGPLLSQQKYARYLQDGDRKDSSIDTLRAQLIPTGYLSPDGWIETIVGDYFDAANESRWDRLGVMNEQLLALETYADEVTAMLDRIRIAFGIELNRNLLTLDVAVLRCAGATPSLDTLARAVFDGGDDCINERLDYVRRAHLEASRNVSQYLVEWTEEQLRADIVKCTGNDSTWDHSNEGSSWTGDEYELACISQILHQVHLKTLLISHTTEQLTANARALFGTAKADILQCASDLVSQATESLNEISKIIANCQGDDTEAASSASSQKVDGSVVTN